MTELLKDLAAQAGSLGLFGAAVVFVWSIVQFFLQRSRESREKQFEAYHHLVKELVSPDSQNGKMWVDRQAAVVFELRHFPRNFPFTERMLKGLRQAWAPGQSAWPRLLEEIDLTLEHIKAHS